MHTTSLAAAIWHSHTSMPCQVTGCNTGAPPAWVWSAADPQDAQCADQGGYDICDGAACWTAINLHLKRLAARLSRPLTHFGAGEAQALRRPSQPGARRPGPHARRAAEAAAGRPGRRMNAGSAWRRPTLSSGCRAWSRLSYRLGRMLEQTGCVRRWRAAHAHT